VPPVTDRARSAEALIVELMAAEPRLVPLVDASGVLADFAEPEWRAIAEGIITSTGTMAPATVVEGLPRELRDRVVRRLLAGEADDRERILADCIARIRDRRRGRTQVALKEALRAAEARGDADAARLAQEELNRFLSEKTRT
jgi:hypothetical protein